MNTMNSFGRDKNDGFNNFLENYTLRVTEAAARYWDNMPEEEQDMFLPEKKEDEKGSASERMCAKPKRACAKPKKKSCRKPMKKACPMKCKRPKPRCAKPKRRCAKPKPACPRRKMSPMCPKPKPTCP
ncbi:histone-like protein 18C [Drosophila kikkawai]|uniref:Histone-like protein 18C n=1 Tax=Drosophila kikkawai TaxID=30033 RepID=A0ABM4GG77_DROKI